MSGLADRIAGLSPDKRRALARMLREQAAPGAGAGPRRYERFHPLSPGQWIMWFAHQLAPESPAYNVALALAVEGPLDLPSFERAAACLVERHAALRTTYGMRDGQPVQEIHARLPIAFSVADARGLDEAGLAQAFRRAYERPFDLERGPQLRLALFRRGVARHALLVVAHHAVLDLWSIGVLLEDLTELYGAERQGRPASLPPQVADNPDFVRWQGEMLAGPRGEELAAWWRQALAPPLPVLNLATDRQRPPVQSLRGATLELEVGAELTAALRRLARCEGATLYGVLLAAWMCVLARHSGDRDLLVGSPMAGRGTPELSRVVGCLMNFVVVRGDLSGDPTFRELVGRISRRVAEAVAHQDFPFARLTAMLGVARDAARQPLTGVAFSLDKAPVLPAGGGPAGGAEIVLSPLPFLAQQEGQFDLYLEMAEAFGRIVGALRYSTDLFDRATAERFGGQLLGLLASVAQDAGASLSRLAILSAAERRQLLSEWNRAEEAELPAEMLPARFAWVAAEQGDRVALRTRHGEVSYRELARRSRAVGEALAGRGAGAETVVAVLAERDGELPAAMLGIWWAGGAYLPLDPEHPAPRWRQVLASSRAAVVLVAASHRERLAAALAGLPAAQRPEVVELEPALAPGLGAPAGGRAGTAALPAPVVADPQGLAYVIYTSGSTGQPKGAMVTHRGMLNHLRAKIEALSLGEADVVAATASQCFDISLWQVLAALLVGGQVWVASAEEAQDPALLWRSVRRQGVTVLETVPSLLAMLLAEAERQGEADGGGRVDGADGGVGGDGGQLRWMIATGEALPPALAERWLRRFAAVPLVNAYGPTECADDVTHEVLREWAGESSVAIGRPVLNLRLYVLGSEGELLPVGAMGELQVGGIAVGRGYLGEPERTAEAFVPDPWSARGGERLYRTGDLAR
ncbi:MAG TPA: amino acid adenylation domain-containing protein, partial [Thermoanaerobaculia bacterium]|nr:amino acid adenylation domain-containing protein [Thermoanaerobaculia bacterium]